MFSMAAVSLPERRGDCDSDLDPVGLARIGVLRGTAALTTIPSARSIDWPELEEILPDRGFPRGVVELAGPVTRHGSKLVALRSGATTIALSSVRAIHRASPHAWCAWITPSSVPSLYAPSVAKEGIDLERLLVVRPELPSLGRTAVKAAASGAFDLVVVDAQRGLGQIAGSIAGPVTRARVSGHPLLNPMEQDNASLVVRKLSLAAEENGSTTFLLTDLFAPRSVPWPVALRLEVERRPETLAVRVTKDRRGRVDQHGLRASPHVVRLAG
jgi:hypothetical protein